MRRREIAELVVRAVQDGEPKPSIEENPVSAGLVVESQQYPWSSAASRLKGGCGQDWPPHRL